LYVKHVKDLTEVKGNKYPPRHPESRILPSDFQNKKWLGRKLETIAFYFVIL